MPCPSFVSDFQFVDHWSSSFSNHSLWPFSYRIEISYVYKISGWEAIFSFLISWSAFLWSWYHCGSNFALFSSEKLFSRWFSFKGWMGYGMIDFAFVFEYCPFECIHKTFILPVSLRIVQLSSDVLDWPLSAEFSKLTWCELCTITWHKCLWNSMRWESLGHDYPSRGGRCSS